MHPIIYLVLPCYNEEEILDNTSQVLINKINDLVNKDIISQDSRIVFVNDGSSDNTWDLIRSQHESNSLISGINLSINKGHQNALLAGMMTVYKYADAIITMDADLQDDVNAIEEMIIKFIKGADIVYGVRSERDKDSYFKKHSAELFYRLMNKMGADTVFNHADFRLLSRRAVHVLESYKEVNIFLRGMIPLMGLKSDVVYYKRGQRLAGKSKYPLNKMIPFAVEGITSLSIKPIRAITFLGVFIFIVSIVMLIWTVVAYAIYDAVPGWTSLMVSLWALGETVRKPDLIDE